MIASDSITCHDVLAYGSKRVIYCSEVESRLDPTGSSSVAPLPKQLAGQHLDRAIARRAWNPNKSRAAPHQQLSLESSTATTVDSLLE